MKLKHVILFFQLLIFWQISLSQDISFSQFYANPVFLNPALAGTTECGRINANYRNQWMSLPNAYATYNISYDQSIPDISSGFGFTLTADNAGDGTLLNYMASGIYSYNLIINENLNFMAGFQASYQYYTLNWDNLIFGDQLQFDGTTIPSREIRPDNETSGFFDMGVGGVLGIQEHSFIGGAVHHLTEPENDMFAGEYSKLPMKYTIHGGTIISLTEGTLGSSEEGGFTISPNILYQQQGSFKQLNAGMYFNIDPLVLGGWFRYNFDNADAAIALIGVKYDRFRFGYSYDFTLSKLTGSGGSHEASLAYSFCVYTGGNKIKKIRAIKSPVF